MQILVENIKCGGCASGITKALLALPNVNQVEIEIETGRLNLDVVEDSHALRDEICAVLLKMGYPEQGSVEGLKAAGAKAKSFVSCAIGKMNQE